MVSPYKLARLLLPAWLLRRLGNRNKVRRATTDKLFYRFCRHPSARYLHERTGPTTGVASTSLEDSVFISPRLKDEFRRWYDTMQCEHIISAENVIIEPHTGWPMGQGGQLYLDLYPNGKSPYMPTPPYASCWRRQPMQAIERAIILRDVNEHGYSHFYTDLMARLVMLESYGVELSDYTVILGGILQKRAYVQHLLAHAPIFQRVKAVIFQTDQFIRCKEAFFVHVFVNPTATVSSSFGLFERVTQQAKAAHLVQEPYRDDRLFLVRGKQDRRRLRSQDAILELLKPEGFEPIDTSFMSLPQQIERFSHCRHLVGIHGAGLANMLYRAGNRMSVFEISEPAGGAVWRNPLYHNMAVALRYDYGIVESESKNMVDQSIMLEPAAFEAAFKPFWQAAQASSGTNAA